MKMSTAALALTFAVMLTANVAPTSATWLWAFEPRCNEPDRSIILALHGLTLGLLVHTQSVALTR